MISESNTQQITNIKVLYSAPKILNIPKIVMKLLLHPYQLYVIVSISSYRMF